MTTFGILALELYPRVAFITFGCAIISGEDLMVSLSAGAVWPYYMWKTLNKRLKEN